MDRNEIIGFLGEDWRFVDTLIAETLSTDVSLLARTNERILAHGGKKLRPMVTILMGRACNDGKSNDDCLRYAAASELLHNATLLHDDVADQSDTRRGEPTTRSVLGPGASVLVGDFWLASAVKAVMDTNHRDDIVQLLSKTLVDLSEGEMFQLEKADSADTTQEDYLRIIYCKTASLFEAACAGAALSVDAGLEYRQAAENYGRALGLAFQIQDDILDYDGDVRLGKPVGSDLRERKITLPLIGALKNCPDEGEIRKMVREIPSNPDNVLKIHRFVMENGGVEYASEVLEKYIVQACSALDRIPFCPEKDFLCQIASYNSHRAI